MSSHYVSETHIKSIINFICSKKLNYESALIDLTMDPLGAGAPLSAASATTENYAQFVKQLTDCMADTALPSNPTTITSNRSQILLSIFLIILFIFIAYDSIYASARASIQQMDRDPNSGLNLQVNRNEYQLSESMMCLISSRITNSSSNDVHENQHTMQNEVPPSASEESVNTY